MAAAHASPAATAQLRSMDPWSVPVPDPRSLEEIDAYNAYIEKNEDGAVAAAAAAGNLLGRLRMPEDTAIAARRATGSWFRDLERARKARAADDLFIWDPEERERARLRTIAERRNFRRIRLMGRGRNVRARHGDGLGPGDAPGTPEPPSPCADVPPRGQSHV